MHIPKIKHIGKLTEPKVRKRDGELCTHVLHIAMTTDEALELSQMFVQNRTGSINPPTNSLVRVAIMQIAEQQVCAEKLVEDMAQWRTRKKLAEELSDREYVQALSLLKAFQEKKIMPSQPVNKTVKPTPQRREYIPPPQYNKFSKR